MVLKKSVSLRPKAVMLTPMIKLFRWSAIQVIVMLKIIMKRIERKREADINVVQAGFRQGSGTRDHIFNLRMIIQKCREFTNHFSRAL